MDQMEGGGGGGGGIYIATISEYQKVIEDYTE